MPAQFSKPEIMSPAGYWPQLHAAIEAGADSVYFGLKHFTARAKVGFALGELPEVMRTLHGRGVKGFVTFNTLVFDHELDEAVRAVAAIAEAGADAIIVQDLAILRLAHRIAPSLELHASTQMSVTNAEGVRLAQEMGATRVTLARELSIEEVRAIRAATSAELEIFVHGALCVAYSGQCFSSEAWGGRSANRGQCAQACRLPYDLIVDGARQPLGDARYLLSPGDLYGLHHVPEIVDLGVSALKIEGRYKDSEYVALTTRAYRNAVDEACAGRALSITAAEELQLESAYSRGLGPFFLTGTNHQQVVRGRVPRHRGVLMGRVARVERDGILIQPAAAHRVAPLKRGDGLVFDAADWRSPEEPEEGGRVFDVMPKGKLVRVEFGAGAVNTQRVRQGDLVWRSDDPDVQKAASAYTQARSPMRRQAVAIEVHAAEGAVLRTSWRLTDGKTVEVESDAPLEQSQTHVVSHDLLFEQLGRLGGTQYELSDLVLHVEGRPFAPASVLNAVRRRAVELLQRLQTTSGPSGAVYEPGEVLAHERTAALSATTHSWRDEVQFHLLVRSSEQLEAALEVEPASITLDYLDLYGLRPSVERVKAAGIAVRVASPRILKPGEERVADFLLRLDAPVLVRSAGLLERWRERGPQMTGDFSLNAANALAARLLLDLGLQRITPTHDLNAAQIATLAEEVGPTMIEAIAYGHLPVFHTEHCVFCRFLSKGTTYKDCGRPCENHMVSIRDTGGRAHPVLADVGCRNTVFGAEAQEASSHLASWLKAGIRDFRLEFAHETAANVRAITRAFLVAVEGRTSLRELREALRGMSPQGATEGSLYVPSDYLTLPVLQ